MEKVALRCKTCQNKMGETQLGTTTFRHKGRMMTVYTGFYPCVVRLVCEKCQTETIFEICAKEIVAKE